MTQDSHIILEGFPPFYRTLHVQYVAELADKLEQSFEGAVTSHLRMSGVYWSLTALSILETPERVDELMGLNQRRGDRQSIVEWVFDCFDEKTGGFGGNTNQDAHLLYTLSAIQILALADRLDDDRLEKERVIAFVANLQQPDGSFAGDRYGEIDTRFTYCALSSLSLLKAMDRVDVNAAAEYIIRCRNMDGGFGCVIGAESHTGQVFTCIGALAIAQRLDLLDKEHTDLLGWWLAERQCDSGGLNGRSEKQADLCYSFWAITAMMTIDTVSWINRDKLVGFILKCQDPDDGGLADRPDDMVDVFHTFFGIAGLSLLGHLHKDPEHKYRQIDPIYALPTDLVTKLGLPGQALVRKGKQVESRLAHYNIRQI